MKKKISFILVLMLILLTVPQPIYAENIGDNANAKKLWDYLVGQKGCTELWAAATIGNAYSENGLKTNIDVKNNYWGAFQFLGTSSQTKFKNFASSKGYNTDDIIAQYEFFIQEYRGSCCKSICGIDIKEIEKDTTYIKDARSAAAFFAAGMEGCVCWSGITKGKGKIQDSAHKEERDTSFDFGPSGSKYGEIQLQNLEGRQKVTEEAYKAFTGSVAPGSGTSGEDTGSTVNSTEDVSKYIVPCGSYTESQLSSALTLAEGLLEKADIGSLTVNEMDTLKDWNANVESNTFQAIFIRFLRMFVSFLGIMFTVWMIFLYLAYWFDRTNVFLEISLLQLLSFGRLRVSPEDDKCTWQFSELLKNKSTDKTMTVNHRAMLTIVVIGCVFGGMIVSGNIFKLISMFITWVLSNFNILR